MAACMPRLSGLKPGWFSNGLSQTMRRARRRSVGERLRQKLRLTGVVAVADDDHAGARMHQARARGRD